MTQQARKVVVTDYSFPSIDIERRVLELIGATVEGHQCKTEGEVEEAVGGAHVVLTQFAKVGASAIRAMHSGGVIIRYGVGVDNVDLDAAAEAGIAVANVPDYCVDEVADHTVAMLLGLLRHVPCAARKRAPGRMGCHRGFEAVDALS